MRALGASIHVNRDQWHLAWDHSIEPIYRVQSGDVIEFDLLEASCGQIVADSTVDAIATLDFSRVDQVNGPIYVEGAEPGDLRSRSSCWTCNRLTGAGRRSFLGLGCWPMNSPNQP